MLLKGENLSFKYSNGPMIFEGLDIQISRGELVGLVARSGYGKSTLAKVLAGYEKPKSGQVLLEGGKIDGKSYRPVQLIYQHPEKSINPRWRMKKVLEEAGPINYEIIEKLGIEESWLTRYPRELSGGELQRFSVARALNNRTKFIIADEISTMLDPITQAQIWKVIIDYSRENNVGLLIISHNKDLLKRLASRIIDLEEVNQSER